MAKGNDYLPGMRFGNGADIGDTLQQYLLLRAQPRWRDRALTVLDDARSMLAFDVELFLHLLASVVELDGTGDRPLSAAAEPTDLLAGATRAGLARLPEEVGLAAVGNGATDPRLAALEGWLQAQGATDAQSGSAYEHACRHYMVRSCWGRCSIGAKQEHGLGGGSTHRVCTHVEAL